MANYWTIQCGIGLALNATEFYDFLEEYKHNQFKKMSDEEYELFSDLEENHNFEDYEFTGEQSYQKFKVQYLDGDICPNIAFLPVNPKEHVKHWHNTDCYIIWAKKAYDVTMLETGLLCEEFKNYSASYVPPYFDFITHIGHISCAIDES